MTLMSDGLIELEVGDKVVMIVECDCECGGKYAWFIRDKDDDAWTSKGCICHNPALGV